MRKNKNAAEQEGEFFGTCRFCGQRRIVRIAEEDAGGDYSQEDLDSMATDSCDCLDARRARNAKDSYQGARDNCDTVAFLAVKNGIIEEEDQFSLSKLLKECINELETETVESVTVKKKNWTLKLSRSADRYKFGEKITKTEKNEF